MSKSSNASLNQLDFNITDLDLDAILAELKSEKISSSKKKYKLTLKTVVLRFLLCFFTFIVITVGGLFGGITIINYGPSPSARNLFVASMLETSAAKFLATWYFSEDEINSILNQNTVIDIEDTTDTDLIEIPTVEDNPEFDINKIEVVEVNGSTYRGKMMIINDPSRVSISSLSSYGPDIKGKLLTDHISSNNAIAGVNAGGFVDDNGGGKGGLPLGIVISKGELKYGNLNSSYNIIGIDNKNKLVLGKMTAQAALDKGIRDATTFGPNLIVNGNPAKIYGTGGGLNPRTAIGQRSDGAMLLLVVEGRQPSSIGASLADLIKIMLEFDAVNAANLDGGSSSVMYYKGEAITTCASVYGDRWLPDAVIVN